MKHVSYVEYSENFLALCLYLRERSNIANRIVRFYQNDSYKNLPDILKYGAGSVLSCMVVWLVGNHYHCHIFE